MVSIGQGRIFHSRREGKRNTFSYPSFFLFFDCADEKELQHQLHKNFFGFMSLTATDYLSRKHKSFEESIKSFLLEKCDYHAERVYLHTLPRVFNYAFNPVSFWLCFRGNSLNAVLVEVTNNFKETHYYWIHPDTEVSSEQWYKAEKAFHVSPFFPVDGFYQFRFGVSTSEVRIDINYHAPNGDLRLATWIEGALSPLARHTRLELVCRYGWITPLVVLRIHYQALKLWFKKIKFYTKPNPPSQEVSQ